MSYELLGLVRGVTGLTPTEKLVLYVLADRADNERHECWPSVAQIAADCGMSRNSRRNVRDTLNALRDKGIISWTERHKETVGRDGATHISNTSHIYTVNLGSVGAESTRVVNTLGAESTPPGCCEHQGVGAESTTKQSSESVNQSIISLSAPQRAVQELMGWPEDDERIVIGIPQALKDRGTSIDYPVRWLKSLNNKDHDLERVLEDAVAKTKPNSRPDGWGPAGPSSDEWPRAKVRGCDNCDGGLIYDEATNTCTRCPQCRPLAS